MTLIICIISLAISRICVELLGYQGHHLHLAKRTFGCDFDWIRKTVSQHLPLCISLLCLFSLVSHSTIVDFLSLLSFEVLTFSCFSFVLALHTCTIVACYATLCLCLCFSLIFLNFKPFLSFPCSRPSQPHRCLPPSQDQPSALLLPENLFFILVFNIFPCLSLFLIFLACFPALAQQRDCFHLEFESLRRHWLLSWHWKFSLLRSPFYVLPLFPTNQEIIADWPTKTILTFPFMSSSFCRLNSLSWAFSRASLSAAWKKKQELSKSPFESTPKRESFS